VVVDTVSVVPNVGLDVVMDSSDDANEKINVDVVTVAVDVVTVAGDDSDEGVTGNDGEGEDDEEDGSEVSDRGDSSARYDGAVRLAIEDMIGLRAWLGPGPSS